MTPETATPPDLKTRLGHAVTAALSRKAEDLKVLDLTGICDFSDYFVLCTGTNERQVQAISEAVEDRLRDDGLRPLHVEGRTHGKWVLLDYGSILVHVFKEETRAFYRLENLWADGTDVTDQLAT